MKLLHNRRHNHHCHHQQHLTNGQCPLTMISPGKRVTLIEIIAGHRVRHRLTELGLTPGVELQIVQDEGGPLLLAVHDSRLALGRGMAHKIMVQAGS